ncbi:MAG TPA: DNA/RNA non-specific endonuclease, partial [Myxococcaceae bacterium]|nr:DNA/RNA non-specific endonuclease [Myxococcaceae bacterium]
QVVALHHSGVPKRDAAGHWLTVDGQIYDPSSMDESRAAWEANEGIRVSAICEHLRSRAADHPLARRVLEALGSQVTSLSKVEVRPGTAPGNGREIRIVLQLPTGDVPVVVPAEPQQAAPARNVMRVDAPSPFADRPRDEARPPRITYSGEIEKVNVDQSNYAERPGYDPDFLGQGLKVPMPTVSEQKLKKDVLLLKGRKGAELKYWNYSVIMNGARRLAIVSAVNVDPTLRSSNEVRDGDRWYADPRIEPGKQIGAEFYSKQTTFEDRENNPFDKGHLTRRLDAQWGAAGNARRNGDDSFHWTNCSPQHWKFNQGSKRWLGLEDYVIRTFAGGSARACVFNGCVFDAPRSKAEDGRRVPDLDPAHRVADPTFGEVSIPKSFYKVVTCVRAGRLAVAAFLMSQEDLLEQTGRVQGLEELTQEDAKLYQVRLGDLAKLIGLSFGLLEDADTAPEEEAVVTGPRPIHRFEDIRPPLADHAERLTVRNASGRRATQRRPLLKA